jgi:hypothetical protein
VNYNSKILHLMTIFLTVGLFISYFPNNAFAGDTEVEDVDIFEENEVPSADDPNALGDMEKLVLSDAATIEDADAESKKAKIEAENAEKQLAEAQKRLNEMKLYKASLAQKTKQDVVEAEKRKLMADKERQTLDAQRKRIEAEVALIQREQNKLEQIERIAKIKAEKAKAQLAAAKERRNQKRKATTKIAPPASKPNSIAPPTRKTPTQQARI